MQLMTQIHKFDFSDNSRNNESTSRMPRCAHRGEKRRVKNAGASRQGKKWRSYGTGELEPSGPVAIEVDENRTR